MEAIKFFGNLKYTNWTSSHWYPLPWGIINIKAVDISIKPVSSRKGAWYWRFPGHCIEGVGKFEPYLHFQFTGEICVTKERDFFENTDRYFARKYPYGFRAGDNKWVYFDGEFKPSMRYITRGYMERIFQKYSFVDTFSAYAQGSLNFAPMEWAEGFKPDLKKLDQDFETKIYNHQFFGNYKIWRIGKTQQFVILCLDDTELVSPDHLDQPYILNAGWYHAEHPTPSKDID
jgi:hypothetical protein